MIKKYKAFSLIELSAVLIIIAILTSITTQIISSIRNAHIANANTITANFNIAQIDGLVAWYETSLKYSLEKSEIIDNKQISTWYNIAPSSITDKINKLETTPSSGITYQEKGINNLPSINFNGSSNLKLSTFSDGDISKATIFFVISIDTHNTPTFFDSYNFSDNNVTIHSLDPDQLYLRASANGAWTSTSSNLPNILTNRGHIIVSYLNGENSKYYFNDAINIAGGTAINPGSNAISGLTIGSRSDNSSHFNGQISEIIIFNKILKLPQRKDVMTYLSKKYNIAVSNL